MNYHSDIHNRRSIRLKEYDYSQPGVYFVNIVTQNSECVFGDAADGKLMLNDAGKIVRNEWLKTAEIRLNVQLDTFVVMPNHLHGIIVIKDHEMNGMDDNVIGAYDDVGADDNVGAYGRTPLRRKPKSLGSIIAGFKSVTTKHINIYRQTPGIPVWQRNYYEHIIRNENELHRIREYIMNNPLKWELDDENPNRRGNS
jgi:putative transposase